MRNEGQRNLLSISPEEKRKMQEDIIYFFKELPV